MTFPVADSSRLLNWLRHELVTCPTKRKDVHGICRFPFEFLSQLKDVVVDGARLNIALVAEHLVQYLGSGNDLLGMVHKKLKNFEFACRQFDRLTVYGRFHLRKVDRNSLKFDSIWNLGFPSVADRGSYPSE